MCKLEKEGTNLFFFQTKGPSWPITSCPRLFIGGVPFLKSHIMCFCGCFIMRNHHFSDIWDSLGFFSQWFRNVGGATHPHAHSPEAYLATPQLPPLPRTWIGEGRKGWKQDETGCFNRIFFPGLRVDWSKHHPNSSLRMFFFLMMLIIATREGLAMHFFQTGESPVSCLEHWKPCGHGGTCYVNNFLSRRKFWGQNSKATGHQILRTNI